MSDEKVAALILTHVRRYDAMDILDVYKLLHQAVFGPGHAIKNQKAAREWLERESEILKPKTDDPMLENIHPDQQIVRLYLRPYLAAQGDLKKLIDAFVKSSKAVEGSLDIMAMWWGTFQEMVQPNGPLANRFNARTISLVTRTNNAEHWPATHHSPAFEQAYKPAYRVLTRPLAEELLQKQKITFTLI